MKAIGQQSFRLRGSICLASGADLTPVWPYCGDHTSMISTDPAPDMRSAAPLPVHQDNEKELRI